MTATVQLELVFDAPRPKQRKGASYSVRLEAAMRSHLASEGPTLMSPLDSEIAYVDDDRLWGESPHVAK